LLLQKTHHPAGRLAANSQSAWSNGSFRRVGMISAEPVEAASQFANGPHVHLCRDVQSEELVIRLLPRPARGTDIGKASRDN